MGVYVVADLHGAADDLRKAVPEGATLLLLGDLLNTLDYLDMTGILVEIFGREAVQRVSDLRREGDYDQAKRLIKERSEGRRDEIRTRFVELAGQQYEAVSAALSDPTYAILGNVDLPPLALQMAESNPNVTYADGCTYEIEGERFGFVGGALPTPMRVAGEISQEEMRSKIESLGDVDVLCSHIPPAVDELCFDTLAGKSEQGSVDLLEYIRDVQPRRHYFGHVHQPLLSSMWVGRTLCVNVGYFRATKRAFPHSRP
ncbi:MAG: metallophosphoesterase [Actinomycetota bacterium]